MLAVTRPRPCRRDFGSRHRAGPSYPTRTSLAASVARVPEPGGSRSRPGSGDLDRAALEPPPLPLGQPAPDPEPLIVRERVVQALGPDLTGQTDPLRLPGRAALLGEERLGIRLRAQRPLLPAQLLFGVAEQQEDLAHGVLLNPVLFHERRHPSERHW